MLRNFTGHCDVEKTAKSPGPRLAGGGSRGSVAASLGRRLPWRHSASFGRGRESAKRVLLELARWLQVGWLFVVGAGDMTRPPGPWLE